jgi:hypothetical protein
MHPVWVWEFAEKSPQKLRPPPIALPGSVLWLGFAVSTTQTARFLWLVAVVAHPVGAV